MLSSKAYTLVKFSELLSFSKVAKELHMTQPCVTYQIKDLEREYDIKIYQKDANKISLTKEGELLVKYAERMISLVEDLLDFSRLSSDRIRLQIDMVDVTKLAKGVVTQLAVKANEKNITLLTEFKTENIVDIQGDKNRLRQVLINLVQNAIKFTSEGGYIVVIVSQGEDLTTFTVTDNGVGIKKENLTKVLDKFFQEDYNKSGSGLGLAISNEIVKLHGGKMILNSKKGVGTSITVKIKNTLIKRK